MNHPLLPTEDIKTNFLWVLKSRWGTQEKMETIEGYTKGV